MTSCYLCIFLLLCVWSYSNAFFASDVNRHLKRYGPQLGSNTMRYGGGVKGKYRSGTKTSYGAGRKTKNQQSSDLFGEKDQPVYEGGCRQIPEKPPNSKLRCSFYSGCSLSCQRGYKLPGDAYAVYILCENGKWVAQGTESGETPSCQPDCSRPCQNQGICIAPEQCNCPEQFSGPQCQYQNKPCMELPPQPQNSRRTCRKQQEYCTVSCLEGHRFPDGSAVATLSCKNGLWVPGRDDWVSIPDCQATCSQPCQNGGICLSLDVCQCPQNFRGPQCQYSVDACTSSKLNFNGGLKCSGDSDQFVCSGLYCAEGMKISHSPAPAYTCKYSEGVFYPTDVPTCTFEKPGMSLKLERSGFMNSHDMVQNEPVDYDYGSSGENAEPVVIENKLPTPGVCYTWGGVHYKTFDGKLYSFDSKCAYTLVKDSADNTFSITVQNADSCYTSNNQCSRVINFYIQGRDYKLNLTEDGNPTLTHGGSVLPIPGQAVGIRTETTARYIHVLLDSVGISLKWDSKTFIQVETKESLWNRTEGLCGNIDGNPDNDIITKSGRRTKNVVTAASSWEVDDVGVHCSTSPMESQACPGNGVKGSLSSKAHEFCKQLLSDSRFLSCSTVLDRSLLIQACALDYCNCKSEEKSDCACDTMNVYVSECKQKGLTALTNWRDASTCPLKCTGGKIYQSCGPSKGQPVCGSSVTSLVVDEKTCEEGCFCPEGKVLHNNVCIPVSKCPCRLRKKEFPAGSSVPKDCNTCVCQNGHWVCTQISCGARCSAIGDPHYTTFDGKKYDFMGKCSYYLIQGSDFSIETENVACPGAISELMSFAKTSTSEMPSCTKTATIRLNGTITIKLRQNNDVLVNGQEITKLPFESSGFAIRTISSIFLLVELPNGLEIWWDGTSRIYVDMPASFKEQTKGLCGTFNRNQKDDFSTSEGDVEQSVISFANKWKTHEACANVPDVVSSHPCDVNMHRKGNAEKLCSRIKSNLFTDCHFYVDPEQYYQDCLYDVCSCQGDLNKCLCTIISSYSHECANKGIIVDWRSDVQECRIQCPAGQQYQVCGDSCTRSCYDISTRKSCAKQCVEGCNCPEGEALDDNGECIPVGQCKCYANDIVFNPGYKEIRRIDTSPDLCTCVNGAWNCVKARPEEMKLYPDAADLKSMCNSSLHLEFTSCEPAEPKTCKNMDSYQRSSSAICHPGCECQSGYVFDPITKECIQPSECPCHHGGKSYRENEVVQNDCNTCNCKAGKWSCSDRQCAVECSAWGDSHYKTFDGKHYDYQGQCDYVLAKGSFGDLAYFDISIQNVPCGSLGTSCSKSISIRVGAGNSTETITMNVGKTLPKSTTFAHLTVREIGLYVIVEAPDLGLTVRWDRGTRVYVRLNPKWKNQVKGLCGNYNDNEMDDFQTLSGGVPEVSPYAFGDSWKLEPSCPEAKEITDTCKDKPERRVWAMRKCGILKSSLFSPCHSEVPIDSFYDKCLFDTCACDQGGDCECLCTALAAYAQECNNRGVPIHWRSQELCPIQCDEKCSTYKPCMSTCLIETCDNIYTRGKISATCVEDTCVEGCQVKTCPAGQVYLNSSFELCVPVKECKSVCMEINGSTYFEGDVIDEDSCHTCYCSRGQRVCKGQPCTQVPISTTTPASLDERVKCVPGWTEWINNNPLTVKGGLTKRPKEIEPLPLTLLLNNLISGGVCSPDQMTDIRCRTVRDKIPAKETGLDAECSLEKGLVCKSNRKGADCPDFEIQVYCQCEQTSRPPSTTTKGPDTTVTTSIVITGEPECKLETRKKTHDDDCYKYYVCQIGSKGAEYVEQTCGSAMMFNPQTLSCDLIDTVSSIRPECALSTTKKEQTTATSYITVTVKPQCNSDMPNKLDENDCRKFYACENGPNGPEYVEQVCKGTMVYNPNTFGCDRVDVVSSIRPECAATTTTTSTVRPEEATVTERFVITSKPSCNSETPNKPHENDCHRYYVCDDGPNGAEYVEQSCGSTMMYNPKTLSCDRIEIVSAIRPECVSTTTTPVTKTTMKPTTSISYVTITEQPRCTSDMKNHQHASDCHKYYACENGPNGPEYVLQICAGTMMYNPNTYGCDRSDVVSTIRPECEVTSTVKLVETTVTQALTGKPSCNSETPNKPHENDCHKYYVCDDGPNGAEYVEQSCGSTMMYNPKTLSCDRIEIVSVIRPECEISTSTSTTEESTMSVYITGQPECNSQTLNKPDKDDCRKFYTCENGPNGAEYVQQTCEGTMLYNPKTFSCDTVEVVRTIRPECDTRCQRGFRYSECAIDCGELCLFYDYNLRSSDVCLNLNCKPGCVEEDVFELKNSQKCSGSRKWANNNTCVDITDCMCVSYDGKPVKPGAVHKESECKTCQCIENYYVCDESACTLKPKHTTTKITSLKTTTAAITEGQTTKNRIGTTSGATKGHVYTTSDTQKPFVIAVNTETPPPVCLYDFIPLVLTQNLPTDVFNASSSRDNETQPKEAIISNKVGSWTPSPPDTQPFLLIDLQKDEPVYGIELKGNPKKDEYVTSYKVLHSKDGVVFSPAITPDLTVQKFRGPIDHDAPSSQKLDVPVEARYIKIVPLTWHEGISIRADVLGCGRTTTTSSTVPITYKSTQVPTTSAPPICTDEMVTTRNPVADVQIAVSSSKDVNHDKSAVNILKPSSWQPVVDSPSEWVEFNFLEPRNLTGFYTKGGDDGWVISFRVKVSHDGKQWNPILDKNSREYVFPANYDEKSKVTNYFPLPVQAQYIRLYPVKWQNTIQVKAEILGCYKPYTTISTVTTAGTTTTVGTTKGETTEAIITKVPEILPPPCNYCPGVPAALLELEACVCNENSWWNGTNCVTRPLCPCVVGSLTYPIGKVFNKEDCSQCICKIGGTVECSPKVCDKCQKGLKSSITTTCSCVCEPCHPDEKLCPTSNICIKSTLWCDGVIHCPDDEISCETNVGKTAKPRIFDELNVCPEIICPPGFNKVPVRAKRTRYASSRYSSGRRRGVKGVKGAKRARRSGTKGGVKGHLRAVTSKLDNPTYNIQECVQYRCIAPPPPYNVTTEECPAENCPPGYQKSDEEMVEVGNKQCPMLICVPTPVPDSVCNITGRTFVTFDGTEYRYDICDHVIARDLKDKDWAIILSKNCTQTCSRDLHIYTLADHFVFHPDLTVEYNDHFYTTDQLKRIGQVSNDFSISKVGNVIALTSLAHGFWIEWNTDGNVKMGVVHSLKDKVDGLCGYFDSNINNDKRKPNGDLAKTTSEFGDSWSAVNETRDACKINTCPADIQNKAWQLCNTVRDEYLSSCSNVVNLDASVSRCLDSACECLLTSTKENITNIGKCKCQLLQSFVVDCLTANPNVEISGWRGQYDCPSNCGAPLIYKDCFQRECEPSCESLSDPTLCPKVDHACYPGCYCPAELVRKGDKCIKPSDCRDCECKVTGPLDFLTYDESNFTVAGNCVYVLTRDVINDKHNQHNFQVLITNGPCAKGNKTCVKKVTVLYGTHTIHVLADPATNATEVIVDSQQLKQDDYARLNDWIKIKEIPKNGLNLLLLADQVEVKIEYPALGVTVRAPSYKYGGKLEGLCGDCNRNPDDDLRLPNGTITGDEEEFSLSWLFDGLPEKQTKEQCKVKPIEACKPLPDSQNPCMHLLDETIFGTCYPVVDYSIYQQWCNKETCVKEGETTDISSVCPIIESYAKECAREGICVNWHFDMCPQPQCTDDKVFSACGSTCPTSCESINEKESTCVSEIVEGCFCPEGKVLKGTVCVPERECIDCDADGHHPDDQWVKDICTNCTCEGRSVLCEKKECPAIGTICEQGYNPQKVISHTEECCDKYTCVPEPTTPVPCSTPQPLICGEDKISKLSKKDDGCYQNICECIPKDQCQPIDSTTLAPLEDGYKRIVDESDCCAKVKLVCKPELCSPPPKCQEFYELNTKKDENKCCPVYSCSPPQNKCIFESAFIAAEQGAERPRKPEEKQKYLKNPSETWTDGPCRECQCQATQNGDHQATCSLKQCPSMEKSADYTDYELAPKLVYNQCCAKFERTACKVKDKTYKLDEEWIEGGNYCTVYKCANNTDGGIIKEVHVTNCDKNCTLGYEYEPAAPDSEKCCGTCKPVACVVNDTVRSEDEEWTSPDFCVHYKCSKVDGSMQVQGRETTCSKISPETLKNYVVNFTKIDGECCDKTDVVACKMDDQVRQIDETWTSADDFCKQFRCSKLDESRLAITEYLTTCNTTCPAGYTYEHAEPLSGKCCGSCEQTACIVDGIVRDVDEHWKSDDFCTHFSCIKAEGMLQVEKRITKCHEIPTSTLENYVIKSEKVPGRCCNKSEVIACKGNGTVYKAGETWTVGTDYCKKHKCVAIDEGLAISVTETKCNTTCPAGYEYVEPTPDDATCCGECVQAACIVNGTVRQVGEQWASSDYCNKFKCEKFKDALLIVTTNIECKPIPEETLKKFVVNSTHVPGRCCNHSEIVACRGNDRSYDIGETWIEGDNYCQKFECVKENELVGIREYVTQCNATCPAGFEYEPASKDEAKCCGTCQQVHCVIDGKVREIGQEWDGDDYCSKYKCANISGSIQVETRKTVCQPPSVETLKEFVIEETPIKGQCCPLYKEVACKTGNDTHKIGETWTTDDRCKNITCTRNDQGQVVKKELIETCKEYCDKGYQYVSSNQTCCGTCVEVACVFGGLLKKPGDIWSSPDGCTNYTCEKDGDHMIVSANKEQCPNLSDCPPDHIYNDGCCKKCNVTSENLLSCALENIPLDATVKLIKTENIQHGVCVNMEPITNLTQCVGSCESSTLFDIRLGKHASVCTCCQALQYAKIPVAMVCDDGFKWEKHIEVPSVCSCNGCQGGSPKLERMKAPTKSGRKTGHRQRKTGADPIEDLLAL